MSIVNPNANFLTNPCPSHNSEGRTATAMGVLVLIVTTIHMTTNA